MSIGAMAVSIMPGCVIGFGGPGKNVKDGLINTKYINGNCITFLGDTPPDVVFSMKDTEPEPATATNPINWRLIEDHPLATSDVMSVSVCTCKESGDPDSFWGRGEVIDVLMREP